MDASARSTRRVIVLRHASAGTPLSSRELDVERPLDVEGRAQSELLAESLLAYEPTTILTSPATRCIETVAPLADSAGLELERRDELAIGADRASSRALIETCPDGAILCTHREVISDLLGPERMLAKGDAVLLEFDRDGAVTLSAVPGPAPASQLQPA